MSAAVVACLDQMPDAIRGIGTDWAQLPEDLQEQYHDDVEWACHVSERDAAGAAPAERDRILAAVAKVRRAWLDHIPGARE